MPKIYSEQEKRAKRAAATRARARFEVMSRAPNLPPEQVELVLDAVEMYRATKNLEHLLRTLARVSAHVSPLVEYVKTFDAHCFPHQLFTPSTSRLD